jgi:hypothetical protein
MGQTTGRIGAGAMALDVHSPVLLVRRDVGNQRIMVADLIVPFIGDSFFDVTSYNDKILLLFWLLAGVAACLPVPARRAPIAGR